MMATATGATPKQFKRSFCSRVTSRKYDLEMHLALHVQENDILCDLEGCGHVSSCKFDATEHTRLLVAL
jgi:hypothetical protein